MAKLLFRKLRDNDVTVLILRSRHTRPGMLTLSTSLFPSVACSFYRTLSGAWLDLTLRRIMYWIVV